MSRSFSLMSPGTHVSTPCEMDGLFFRNPSPGYDRYLRKTPAARQGDRRLFPDIIYEQSEDVREIIEEIDKKTPVIFVSGRAGTGKSRLINYLAERDGAGSQIVVAPTGIAALSLGAPTIHALFRLPFGVVDADNLVRDCRVDALLRRVERLVIDEISMTRADILDAIDARLRQARGTDAVFGGVQVVMVGDFLQLPPVVAREDRAILEALGYDTPFAFSAKCLKRSCLRILALTRVWRQSDPDMVGVLAGLREGRHLDSSVAWLNARCAGPHRAGAAPLYLTATRAAAHRRNGHGIRALRETYPRDGIDHEVVFEARASGVFKRYGAVLPAPRYLALLPGMRVMAVRNDPSGAFVNGSLGEVRESHDGGGDPDMAYVIVRFDGAGRDVHVRPMRWDRSISRGTGHGDTLLPEATGSYCQIPLTPGYAITIHKSQGLTLEDVRLDIDNGTFAPGQMYVALSRARSVAGLSFTRPLVPDDIRIDEMLVRFLDFARSARNINMSAHVPGRRAAAVS